MAAGRQRSEWSAYGRGFDIEIDKAGIPGVLVFRPTPHRDERGFFSRTFDADLAREAGLDPNAFVQDSVSRSVPGVVRGLHLRLGDGEAKLVRCSVGRVFDVVVDLRPGSPTYRRVETFKLDGNAQISIYIPAGCAHGFQVLEGPADVSYRIDRPYSPKGQLTISLTDEELAIPWPRPVGIRSPADAAASPLASLAQPLAAVLPYGALRSL